MAIDLLSMSWSIRFSYFYWISEITQSLYEEPYSKILLLVFLTEDDFNYNFQLSLCSMKDKFYSP